jgi:prepilin-type N-terminal cleavage/methylation domain-containing protein
MSATTRAARPAHRDDSGFTLVEMMIAMILMLVVVAVSMTVITSSQRAASTSRQLQNLNEEARQAINRMARDLREADTIVTAVNPDGPAYNPNAVTAVRFFGDYNGDGCAPSPTTATAACPIAYSPANPEDITYCYAPSTMQLYVIDNQATGVTPITSTSTSCSGGQPLLAGNVGGLKIEYRSRLYNYDTNPTDGVTTWRELDAAGAPVGNNDGQLDVELAHIDSLVLTLTMRDGGHTQVYRTQVDLRNVSQ